ncbi:hypothetical protein I4641_02450 [Waterburya agarophytonicola K14]|uniref:Uncharacterized protein n=1 Tax=Waterburya agarophytonicola KI4 TaxID=2874699 RepID=A0A964FEG2_9CYAN|nr:hypothetical protein [Waterburya agarophytonicola]MCC0175842.1 hypothetical protein [Waterburya agarophytonicola KI4]
MRKDKDFDREILEQSISTIQALGEKSKIAIIPREYLLPWLIITTISYVVIFKPLQFFLGLGYFWLLVIIIWFCTAWALIAGRKSHNFTDEFYPLPEDNWIDVPQTFIPATDKMFPKLVTKKIKLPEEQDSTGKSHKYIPFQNESELHGNMRVSIAGQDFVSILRCNKDLEWSASVPFNLVGLHPQLEDSEIINQSQAITNALKDIPQGESICFVFGCRSHCDKRKRQLTDLINEKFPIMGIMLESEKLKIEEITQKGLRQEWHHYAIVNWSQKNQDIRQNSDTISVFINLSKNFFAKYFRKMVGTENNYWRRIYITLGRDIYSNSFLPWKIRLESKGKLLLSSLNHLQAYELLANRFNNHITRDLEPDIPQKINVSDISGKLKHRVVINNPYSPKDLLSKLIEGDEGVSNCPNHDSRRDRIRIRNDLVAVLKLVYPPEKVQFSQQPYWVWDRIKHPSVRDTDVFLEITPGNVEDSRTNLKRLVRQSSYANKYAADKGNIIDVDADQLSDEAIEAQRRLKAGAQPLLVSFTIHVYRQSDIELDIACQRLIELFAPAKLVREDKVCWKRWMESLPINNHKILTSSQVFSEPRITMDTESIRSLLPLIRPRDIHFSGVEFINTEGGYPIYINIVEECLRGIITGGTGSGKTVMAFSHIKQALAREDRACVGFDMSNEGEGTLKPIMELLGEQGAYINLIDESFNILQPPDLRKHNPDVQSRRFKIWLESRKKIITAFAVGSNPNDDINTDIISAIVTLALEVFFSDIEIVRRYNAALENGWKSPEWQNIPILEDFLFFCSKDKLDLSDFGSQQGEALDIIVTNISAKLVDPNIGDCISKPSTVSPHARLQFFGLSGLSDDNNAYVLSLVAHGACLNASLEYEKNLVIIDECPALFRKPGFTELVGMQFSLGRKEGTSVLLIGQNIEAITQCENSSQIIRNTDFHFIGKISSDGIEHYSKVLHIPARDLRQNAGDTFGIDKNMGCSYWLIKYLDKHWITAFYPSIYELAGLANSPDEKRERQTIMNKYPNSQKGKCLGLAEYASIY